MKTGPRYTLIIPTYNRPAYLRSLLGYLAARRFAHPIRILDSSYAQAVSQNQVAIGQAGLDIRHQVYDPSIAVAAKIALGMQSVETPYCSFCADDDILLTSHLDGILDLLDANPSLVAAHGYYININPGSVFDISDIFYWAPSIEADDPLRRIVDQMSSYQAIFYAVHRTSAMRSVLSQLERAPSLLAQELLSSSLTLIAGGVRRLPHFYMARNTGPSIETDGWHPHQYLAKDPALLFRDYGTYRTLVVEQLLADAKCRAVYSPDQLQRIFDLVHLKYLTPMISLPIIDYLLAASLRAGNPSSDIMFDIQNLLGPPSDEKRAGGRSHLSHLWQAVSQPRHALRILAHAARVYHLVATLKFRESLKVQVGRGLDKLHVDRTARDGRARRYVLSRSFLNRQLPGTGSVTAADIGHILEQLDDYV